MVLVLSQRRGLVFTFFFNPTDGIRDLFDCLLPDLRENCFFVWLDLSVNDGSQCDIRVIEDGDTFQLAHEVHDALLGLLAFDGC